MQLADRKFTPSNATLHMIPDGASGIGATLSMMSALSRDGRKSMLVRETALCLISGFDQKDYSSEVRALHAFVRDSIRYVQDPDECELIQTPDKTIELCAGDCDDKSILLAALLGSIGYVARYRAIGFQPGIFEHVYVETKLRERWIPLETTEPVEAGWQPDESTIVASLYRKA